MLTGMSGPLPFDPVLRASQSWTQHYPDAPNHIGQKGWPSVVVAPGKTFTSRTAFAFSVDGHSLNGTNPFK